PADHGRPITREEFEAAQGQEGFHYELIEGKVYVSPVPDLPHERIGNWLYDFLNDYSQAHLEVINYVSTHARVILPEQALPTNPEPDLAAYCGFPRDASLRDLSWDDISPILVIEIVSEDKPEKDLERNVDLYLHVPTIPY